MIGVTPRFPAFDDWQKMSERDQDALISRMEAARRRGTLIYRLLIALACTVVGAAIGFTLLGTW